MSKRLIIARGLPGSGKSTACWNYCEIEQPAKFVMLSTDTFFTCVYTGVYKWVPHLLSEAHEWNKLCCLRTLHTGGYPLVFIDNTNIKRSHYQVYIDLAKTYGYSVGLLESSTPWAWDVDECFKRNAHGVPRGTISRMKAQYEQDDRFETVRLPYEG